MKGIYRTHDFDFEKSGVWYFLKTIALLAHLLFLVNIFLNFLHLV